MGEKETIGDQMNMMGVKASANPSEKSEEEPVIIRSTAGEDNNRTAAILSEE